MMALAAPANLEGNKMTVLRKNLIDGEWLITSKAYHVERSDPAPATTARATR